MPLVELYFGKGELSDEKKNILLKKVTDLIVEETQVPQQYTWVIMHELQPQNWMIDRLTVPELLKKIKETER